MEIGKIYHGFKLVSIKEIKDFKATQYEFLHLKSNGRAVWFKNEDQNKTFAYSFRTLPEDSTGICHILEHSVLCGSDKYPLKEPFVNLLKTSLATFLNAMTANDFTTYPVSSMNNKDFNNLMDVYMDAVLNPLSVKDIKPFLQEGWHYEIFNKDEDIRLKGVVYNEMKGAMSGAQSIVEEEAHELLFAGSGYGYNSGGEPRDIPNLTYDYYKEFYKNHYHPANGLIILYGDLDIDEKLGLIEPYLDKYEAREFKPLETPKTNIFEHEVREYPIDPEGDLSNSYYYAIAHGLASYDNPKDILGLKILNRVLFDTNDSPVTKKILDLKLGKDLYSYIDDSCAKACSMMVLCDSSEGKLDEFVLAFKDVLKEQVENKIDRKALIAELNSMEYASREANQGKNTFQALFKTTQNFLYGYPLDYNFNVMELSKEIREEIDNNFFEQLIEKYYLNSNHFARVELKPSLDKGEKDAKALAEKLQAYKESLSEEELSSLIEMNNELLAYQSKEDSKEDLEKLPTLKTSDLNKEIPDINTSYFEEDGKKYFTHEVNTNNITYIRLIDDLNQFTEADLPYIKLLQKMFCNLATEKYSLTELGSELKTYLGSFSFDNQTSLDQDNFKLREALTISFIDENVNEVPRLFNEIIYNTIFDKEKVKTLLEQYVVAGKEFIIQSGDRVARAYIKSTLNKSGYIENLFSGYQYYEFLKDLLDNYENSDLCNKLRDLANRLFNKETLIYSITGNKEAILKAKEMLKELHITAHEYQEKLKITLNKQEDLAIIIPSNVNYVASGIDLSKYTNPYNGYLNLCLHVLNFDYLWSEVRVKGGAYGVRALSFTDGTLTVSSFRDPNVKNTYEVMHSIPNYLTNLETELNDYIIGAMSRYEDVRLVFPKVVDEEKYILDGISKEERKRVKLETINANLANIKEFKKMFEALEKDGIKCVVGNADKIKEFGEFTNTKKL